ncbi:MAG: 4-alpha-glucanotransferase [Rhodobacteraceae bacterium]|nr:4-alpha-glucanotransferase [Paracoccaceae bacterium]
MTPHLDALCEHLGIVWRYHDGAGRFVEAPTETKAAILRALGYPAQTEDEAARHMAELQARAPVRARVVTEGRVADLPAGAELHLESGDKGDPLAPVPRGLHRVVTEGCSVPLVSAPARLDLPPRGWGMTAPLYGLWEGQPAGLGDYALLGDIAAVLGEHGADFLGINPIHAGFPGDAGAISPYAPSHRARLDIRHVAVARAAGSIGALIDHRAEIPAQMAALRAAFAQFDGDPDFTRWRQAEGQALEVFATHQALSDQFGPRWPDWPTACHDPNSPEVQTFAARNPERLRFHAWAQWMAQAQLDRAQARARDAGMRHGLYLDLAVGTHPDGAEAWADPRLYARSVSLGAPPDAFAPDGQSWGLAPLDPQALLARNLEPFAAILRAQFRQCGLLRIDHILGFARAFWVPPGLPGAYVTMPRDALLAVARLEAARAGAYIVGEDLGVIPEGLRTDLEASGVLGCRVMMFEVENGDLRPPGDWPEAILASFSTHDLPTYRGWQAAREIDWWARIGNLCSEAADAHRARRRADRAALEAGIGGPAVADMHRALAATPARLVAVQAEDVLECEEQANLPGTVTTHPNWRRRLPIPVSGLHNDPRLQETAHLMAAAGRGRQR